MNCMKHIGTDNENDVLIDKRFMWLLFVVIVSLLSFEYIYGEEWRERFVFWMSFPITAAVTYVVFIYWEYEEIISFFCSMLYAFLPWKYFENSSVKHNHQYFVIPVIVMIAMEIAMGKSENWKIKHWVIFGIILLGTGLIWTDLGHASFAVLIFSVLYGARNNGKKYFTKTFAFSMLLPISLYIKSLHEGDKIKYTLSEISSNSLKIFDFFIPIPNNRFGILSSVSDKVRAGGISVFPALSMGILISIGFLILIIWTVTKKYDKRMHYICVLNMLVLIISHRYCMNVFIGQIYPYFMHYKVFYLFIVLFACMAIGTVFGEFGERIKNNYIFVLIVLLLTIFSLFGVSGKDWYCCGTDRDVTDNCRRSFAFCVTDMELNI